MSGKHTYCICTEDRVSTANTEYVLHQVCQRLGLSRKNKEKLVSASGVIPTGTRVSGFPGLQPLGEITELQLVV